MRRTYYFLWVVSLGVELSLLSLGNWQYARWQQRLAEQTASQTAPLHVLAGTWLGPAVVLDNQPRPSGDGVGLRLLQGLKTSGQTSGQISGSIMVIDRGFMALPANRAIFDAPAYTASGTVILHGVWKPVKLRKGWLGGPDTTTATNILAFLNPHIIHPQANAKHYFVSLTPTHRQAQTSRPLTANPAKHFGYMVQWWLMALIFPLLCFAAFRRKRT